MNRSLFILPALSLVFAACETGGPISSSSFDPLDPAGGGGSGPRVIDTGYRPGAFVKTSMDNAAFFKSKPKGNATADKLLAANTPMKVISGGDDFLKVELDSGEVGFIPPVMVIDQSESTGPAADSGSEVQVWPPEPGGMLPVVDPTLDPDQPTIPSVIDPDDPDASDEEIPDLPSLPDDAPTPGLGAEPPVSEPVPAPTDEEMEETAADDEASALDEEEDGPPEE